jgi:hypothetical protein
MFQNFDAMNMVFLFPKNSFVFMADLQEDLTIGFVVVHEILNQ